jgi:hypothetical protein
MAAYARLLLTTLLAPPLAIGLFGASGCGSSGAPTAPVPVVTGKEPTGGGGYESPGSGGAYEPPGGAGGYEPPAGGSTGSGNTSDGGASGGSSSGGTTIGSSSGSTTEDCPSCAATYSCVVTPSTTTGSVTVIGAKQADGSCLLAGATGVVVLACDGTVLGESDGAVETLGVWSDDGNGGFTASADDVTIACQ